MTKIVNDEPNIFIMQTFSRRTFFIISTIAVLLALPDFISAQNEGKERPPVSWVNSKLPDGPGLTHRILDSKAMGHEVGYVVWTPEGYDSSGATKYPVVYFLHGMGGTESADSAGFSSILAQGIRNGELGELICVFPNGGRSGYRDGVERMIIDELIPLIDKNYPTQAGRNSRALAGFSMGGAGSVRLAINYPQLFCAAGSMGGGMGFGSSAREMEEALLNDFDRNATFMASKGLAMLLVNGDQDRPEAYDALIPRLKKSGLTYRVMILPDTKHNLGHYYQRSGDAVLKLLNDSLFGN